MVHGGNRAGFERCPFPGLQIKQQYSCRRLGWFAVVADSVEVVGVVATANKYEGAKFLATHCGHSISRRTRVGRQCAPVYFPRILRIDRAGETQVGCREFPAAIGVRSYRYAIAVGNHIANDPSLVAEHAGARYRRRLHPKIVDRVVSLYEVYIARVVPATYEVDVAVFIGHGDCIIDRHRHRRAFLKPTRLRIERVYPGSGHLGTILLDRVTAEHKGKPSRSSSRRSKATVPTRNRRARYPLSTVVAVDPGSCQRILVALPLAETGKTDQEFTRWCGNDDDCIIADGFG